MYLILLNESVQSHSWLFSFFLTQASIMSHLRQRFVAGLVSLSLVYKTYLLYKYKTCHWALLDPFYSYLSRKDALLLA